MSTASKPDRSDREPDEQEGWQTVGSRPAARNVWTDLYDRDIERLTDERDRLRVENEALNLTLVSLWSYLRLKPGENHRCHGLACGIDACILCLAEGETKAALQRSGAFDETQPRLSASGLPLRERATGPGRRVDKRSAPSPSSLLPKEETP